MKLTIPAGSKTKNIKLTVDAPKAKITNKAQFKSIALGGDNVSWVENGKNNTITVNAKMASFKVTKKTTVNKVSFKGSKANVQVNTGSKVKFVAAAKKDATLNIRVNGTVGKMEAVSTGAKLNLRGETDKLPITVKAEGITLTATAAVEVTLEKDAKVVLGDNSEGTAIIVKDGADAEVVNKSEHDVTVTTPEGEVVVEAGKDSESVTTPEPVPEPSPSPEPSPNPPSGGSGGNNGGNSGNGGTVTPPAKSSAKEITSFKIDGVEGKIEGTNITVTVVSGTAVTGLAPTIEVSPKATVTPGSGAVQNFTNPVIYTVKAEDGSTKEYTVTITVEGEEGDKSSAKEITRFTIGPADGTISGTNITVTLPGYTALETLEPYIEVSKGATVTPDSYERQDFRKPVIYTVTAEDGTTQEYTVTVKLNVEEKIGRRFFITVTENGKSYTGEALLTWNATELHDRIYALNITSDSEMYKAGITSLTDFTNAELTIKETDYVEDPDVTLTLYINDEEKTFVNGECKVKVNLSGEGVYLSVVQCAGGNCATAGYFVKVNIIE